MSAEQFILLSRIFDIRQERERKGRQPSARDTAPTPLELLGLSIRPYNALMRSGICTIDQLAQMSREQILRVKNIGEQSITDIERKLEAYLAQHSLASCKPPTLDESISSSAHRDAGPSEVLSAPITDDSNPTHWASLAPQDHTPIEALGLSARSRNPLVHAGVTTLGQLAQMPLEQLRSIRGVGEQSVVEIEEKVRTYHPPLPLVDHALLVRADRVPLDDISIVRLALPPHLQVQLRQRGIDSIGELARQPVNILDQDYPLRERLIRYIEWLVDQNEATWIEETTGHNITPWYCKPLDETTLEALTVDWLAVLSGRQRQVIRWRYGLDDEALTLQEIGERLNVTRERVRQLQAKSQHILKRPYNRKRMEPLTKLLIRLLTEAGGLMNAQQLGTALRQELTIGNVNPIGVARLFFDLDEDIKWHRTAQAWGLAHYPLDEVHGICKQFAMLLNQHRSPLAIEELITRFKATRFYQKHCSKLEDAFIAACLRVYPVIEIDDEGMCMLKKWSNKRLDEIIRALRELGEPTHYSVIAEQTNALLPPGQQTSAHNIHAHMQRLPKVFTRVGHGVYGLSEWGLPDDGSLANAAYRVLSEAGKPLHIDIITEEVLKTWHVRPSSVFAAVENDERFSKIGAAVYCLREQITGETSAQSQSSFGDLFGSRLALWQKELDRQPSRLEFDAHAEVDKVRNVGLDFFAD